jgi:D-aspartate ligase
VVILQPHRLSQELATTGGYGHTLNQAHDSPGAVILGGGFGSMGAARNLSDHGVRVCVIGSATSVARFSWSVSRFAKCPLEPKDEEFLDYLVKMAEKCRVRGWVLFPTSDEHLRIVAQYRPLLTKHYVLTTPPWETVRFLYDKRLTYTLAQEAGVAIPRSHVPGNADRLAALDLDFPVVLKPAISPRFMRTTNKKAFRADNRQELQSLYETMSRVIGPSEVIVQDFLPEPSRNLFSFAGYFRKGEPLAGLSVKRTRQLPRDFGRSSSFVEAVEVPELRKLASQLLRVIHYTGLAEVEFMWDVKRARFNLLEVNARLWAWHSLAVAAGIDLPYIAFADALGQNPTVGAMRQGVKWVRFLTDVRAAAQEILSGTLSLRQYLTSFHGPIAFSVFSPSDPMPFIAEPFLMLFDHLSRLASQRGRGLPPH